MKDGETMKPIRLRFRGYQGKNLVVDELIVAPEIDLDRILPTMAEKHAEELADKPFMIEIEFLDEPDVNQRFIRFGTDPTGMREPILMPFK
jgi:hypothetical protein